MGGLFHDFYVVFGVIIKCFQRQKKILKMQFEIPTLQLEEKADKYRGTS